MNYESEKTIEVKSAIERARKEFKPLKKSGVNAFFKNKKGEPHLFSTLDDIFDSCLDALDNHSLSITYQVRLLGTAQGYENILTTTITELKTGEHILSASLLGTHLKTQDVGSAITYMRRYQIQALLNLEADFEDDGNTASGNKGGDGNIIENKKPSRKYTTFDAFGKRLGQYTDFASYTKALGTKWVDYQDWVTPTIKELNDVIDWTDSFEENDKKHAIKIVNKCQQEINIIKGEK